MKKYQELAEFVVDKVGGKENVKSVSHCVTRLRFYLKDESLAQKDALLENEGVMTVVQSGGQYQVVIGTHVPDVFEEVNKVLGIQGENEVVAEEKTSGIAKVLKILGQVAGPTLHLLSASGILKGLNTLAVFAGLYTMESGIYVLMNGIGDTLFNFFPMFTGFNITKALGGDPFFGMLIGGVLCYPGLSGIELNVFGQTIEANYAGSFLPVIIISILAVYMDKFLRKHLPAMVKDFLSPMIIMLTLIPIGFVFIGPVSNNISLALGGFVTNLFEINPIITGTIIGALWQVLVIFGLHGMIVMIPFLDLLQGNPSGLMAVTGLVAFSQTATVAAIYAKTKNKELKAQTFPTIISGIFGVTEPALYGITLPRPKMFAVSSIGGAIAGLLLGLFNLKQYNFTGLGVFSLIGMINPEDPALLNILIALVVPMIVSFVLGFIVFSDKTDKVAKKSEPQETVINSDNKEISNESFVETIISPIQGSKISVENVNDKVFSSETLGKTVALVPKVGELRAPFNGTVTALYPSKHAIGIESEHGVEVLIHIGIDTVQLEGKYFEALIEQGDVVKQGDLLLTFDIEKIKEVGFNVVTLIVILNSQAYAGFNEETQKDVEFSDTLISVIN